MAPRVEQRMVDSDVEMRVHGSWPFRILELRDARTAIATLGTRSWLSVYFGRGQRITLADGRTGRITGTGLYNWIIPVLVDDRHHTVARATPGEYGEYSIDTSGESFRLVPSEPRTWRTRPRYWEMRVWDEAVARLTTHPERVSVARPVPLAAVLIALTVIDLGIPGEHALAAPGLSW